MRRTPARLVLVLATVVAAAWPGRRPLRRDAPTTAGRPRSSPRATQALWQRLPRRADLPPADGRSRLPPAAGRLLRGHRLAAARDQARRRRASPCAQLLHLGPAGRRGQDEAATRPGPADPRARADLPRARGDPPDRPGRSGSRARARPGTRRASRRDGGWPRQATTSPPATRGLSTSSPRPCGAATGPRARTSASSSAASSTRVAKGPPTRGVVFVVGVGQRVAEVATYKARMQEWLQDSAFWVDMNAYVSDWSQEVYARRPQLCGAGSADRRSPRRARRVPAPPRPARRGGRRLSRGRRTPSSRTPPARSATRPGSGSPASAGRSSTRRPDAALRVGPGVRAAKPRAARAGGRATTAASRGRRVTRRAFPASDFSGADGRVLDRLAAAIRDSALDTPPTPASAPAARTARTSGALVTSTGPRSPTGWRSFRAWSPTTLALVSAPPRWSPACRLAAVRRAGAGRRRGRAAGRARRRDADARPRPPGRSRRALRDRSRRPCRVQLPAGAFATAQVFYQDTTARGPSTLTASRTRASSRATQTTSSSPAPHRSRCASTRRRRPCPRRDGDVPRPSGSTTSATRSRSRPRGPLAPGTPGSLAPATGPTTTFTAAGGPGSGAGRRHGHDVRRGRSPLPRR